MRRSFTAVTLLALAGALIGACSADDPKFNEEVGETSFGVQCAPPAADACNPSCPCTAGQSDCDSDSDCAVGLACGDDFGARFGQSSLFDVCVPAHCTNGMLDAGLGETTIDSGGPCGGCPANGLGDTCSTGCRCPSGWGDCDTNNDCQAGLVCPTAPNGKNFGMKGLNVCVPGHCTNATLDSAQGEIQADCGGPCGTCETSCTNTVDDDGDGLKDCDDPECPNCVASNELVSVDSAEAQGSGNSTVSALSNDGTIVVFDSIAGNLIPGDTNNREDVFARDTGNTTVLSPATAGVVGNHQSFIPSVSSTGAVVAFQSMANNLVTGDTNNFQDVFVRNRTAATTTRVSVGPAAAQSNGHSSRPSLSSNGLWVTFQSGATNLVASDANAVFDVFIHEISSGTTSLVSLRNGGAVQGNSNSLQPSVSGDGTLVVFRSEATNLVNGDTNGAFDCFVRNRPLNATTRASVATGGVQSNGPCDLPDISGNGRYVVFVSTATNLVAGDTNGAVDVFRFDRATSTTIRVSIANLGAQANAASTRPDISTDGRYVVFESEATNLVSGDSNGVSDIFVRDITAGTTRRVSVSATGVQGNGGSSFPNISGNSARVSFASAASNLVAGDANGVQDVFVTPRP